MFADIGQISSVDHRPIIVRDETISWGGRSMGGAEVSGSAGGWKRDTSIRFIRRRIEVTRGRVLIILVVILIPSALCNRRRLVNKDD